MTAPDIQPLPRALPRPPSRAYLQQFSDISHSLLTVLTYALGGAEGGGGLPCDL